MECFVSAQEDVTTSLLLSIYPWSMLTLWVIIFDTIQLWHYKKLQLDKRWITSFISYHLTTQRDQENIKCPFEWITRGTQKCILWYWDMNVNVMNIKAKFHASSCVMLCIVFNYLHLLFLHISWVFHVLIIASIFV